MLKEAQNVLKDFRDFITRGNILELAVAFIMGLAFGKIVTSLVNDIIMPPIGLLMGGVDFSNLYVNMSGGSFPSLAEAKKAGAATLNFGVFVNTIIEFLIVAFVVFLLMRAVSRFMPKPAPPPAEPPTKACPYCLTSIPVKATRCAACTAELPAPGAAPA